jgi:hypothetical protein
MGTYHRQLLPCLRWFSGCICGLPPQQSWWNNLWPYTKKQVKFHPVQSKDVRTVIPPPHLKFAHFFSTRSESAMPSGNLLPHVSLRQIYTYIKWILKITKELISHVCKSDLFRIFTWVSSVSSGKYRGNIFIRPQAIPSKFSPIYYSPIILLF